MIGRGSLPIVHQLAAAAIDITIDIQLFNDELEKNEIKKTRGSTRHIHSYSLSPLCSRDSQTTGELYKKGSCRVSYKS